jgi:DNA-binding response OmpR family regulator
MSTTADTHGRAELTTVMIVEPDILVRMVIADYLRECGYKVVEGVTGDDVFAVLGAGTVINIVFADVNLGGDMEGFKLARRLREEAQNIDVILTAGAAHAANKAGDLCEEGPLKKPYHPHDVLGRIKLLRERRRISPAPARSGPELRAAKP